MNRRVPNIYNFMRYQDKTIADSLTKTLSFGAETNGQIAFGLSQVAGYTEFINLFDQYRINYVEVWFKRATPSLLLDAANTANLIRELYPRCYCVKDYDGGALLTSSSVREYQRCITWLANRNKKVVLKPRTLTSAYDGITTAYTTGKGNNPWIDCSYPDVPHYSLQYVFETPVINPVVDEPFEMIINIEVRYHLSFRNVR